MNDIVNAVSTVGGRMPIYNGASITQLVPFVLAPGDNRYDYTEKLYYAQIYQTYLYAGECQLDGKTYLQVGRWFALDA